jgi:hypothetical protein
VTADIVDGADVRMRQRRNRPRLALESRAAVRIAAKSAGSTFTATVRSSRVSRAL